LNPEDIEFLRLNTERIFNELVAKDIMEQSGNLRINLDQIVELQQVKTLQMHQLYEQYQLLKDPSEDTGDKVRLLLQSLIDGNIGQF
jgi:hypothetical protein